MVARCVFLISVVDKMYYDIFFKYKREQSFLQFDAESRNHFDIAVKYKFSLKQQSPTNR